MRRTLVHLSDLHFGRVDESTVGPLVDAILGVKPDLVVVSGDFTQRARVEEFRAARAFLDRLPFPQLLVPGNHDVPLYNLYGRFWNTLDRYREHITDNLAPVYRDEVIAIAGVSTARALTFKGGRISHEQVEEVRHHFCQVPDEVVKVVVTHHPFDLPSHYGKDDLVGRAHSAMGTLARCGADLFLAGHMHITHYGSTADRYVIDGFSALVVQAGTATSTRGRGEPNSFNTLDLSAREIQVTRWVWQVEQHRWAGDRTGTFTRTERGWAEAEPV